MRFGRTDPGNCLICGAPHCSCGGGGPIVVVQLPSRDGTAPQSITVTAAAPLHAEAVQATLPPGQVTTGTYRRAKTPR